MRLPALLRPDGEGRRFTGGRAYALAGLMTLLAIGVTRFTWPIFARTPFFPLFGAVYVTSRWGSERAGLAAVALGAIGAMLALPQFDPGAFRIIGVFVRSIAGLIRSTRPARLRSAAPRAACSHVVRNCASLAWRAWMNWLRSPAR